MEFKGHKRGCVSGLQEFNRKQYTYTQGLQKRIVRQACVWMKTWTGTKGYRRGHRERESKNCKLCSNSQSALKSGFQRFIFPTNSSISLPISFGCLETSAGYFLTMSLRKPAPSTPCFRCVRWPQERTTGEKSEKRRVRQASNLSWRFQVKRKGV